MTQGALQSRWNQFVGSARGRRTVKAVRAVFTLGIVGYLVYALLDVGLAEVWAALPTHPLFYVFFGLLYFSIPFTEVFLYRLTWTFDAGRSFSAFVKKRIYNKDVLQYSGEVYFYTWARRHVRLGDLEIARTIRDQNIVSSAASTMIAVVLVALFLYTGQISVTEWLGAQAPVYLAGGAVVTLVLVALGVRLRHYLFSMAVKTALLIFVIHLARLVIGQALQIGQWAVAMPEVPLRIWFTYAAVSIVVTRIPLVPNSDLIFLGAGVSLSGMMEISEAGVFGMLGAIAVLGKVLNVVLFAALSFFDRRASAGSPPEQEPPAPAAPRPVSEELV